MGNFTDLVCIGEECFSQTSLELKNFSPTYNGVRFFLALYVMSDIFFSAGQSRPELFCACSGERLRALGNPGARLSLIGFSKK